MYLLVAQVDHPLYERLAKSEDDRQCLVFVGGACYHEGYVEHVAVVVDS